MGVIVEEHELLVCTKCLAVFRTGFRACPRDGEILAQTQTDPLVGTVFAERYQIEGLIGEGGVGRVYKARHSRMSRRYAIKIPYGEVAYDPKVRARFANEAEAASRLSHPNVVGVVDFGETESGLLYMAMDYAEGDSLAHLIGESGPLARDWVIRFTRQIAEGLAHAHDRGLIHRDLKPDNIIIERDGDRPRIVDFGLAIFREQEGGRMTTQGTVLGTPHYMAPEQATGQEIDQRTDLFALGLMMYEMLAGVLPFEGTPVQVARKNLSAPVPLIHERVPGLEVDAGLEALCHHLLAKRAEERPGSANAVIEMLDRLERGDTDTWRMEQQQAQPAPMEGPAATKNLAPRTTQVQGSQPMKPPATAIAPPATAVARDAVPSTGELHELVARPGRRRLVAVAAALVLAGGLVVWRLAGSRETPVAAPPDAVTIAAVTSDAVAIAAVTFDAAPSILRVVDATPAIAMPPDAARAMPARPDARTGTVRPRVDARVVAPPPIDARVAAPPPIDARVVVPPPIDAAPAEVTQKSVTDLYRRIGTAINQLAKAKGEAIAAPLRERWTDLPIMDAGNPALRGDLIRRLRALENDVKAAN